MPKAATRFIRGHVAVDIHHNQQMQQYVAQLIRSEADMAAVEYCMRATGKLYAGLMSAVIEAAESDEPRGVSWPELMRANGAAASGTGEPESTRAIA